MRISAAVFETLQPLFDGIRSDIASLTEIVSQQNESLRHLNDSMASLGKEFEEHKNETESKLSGLEALVHSVIDNLQDDAIGESNPANLKTRHIGKELRERRQDRDGIHEAWLMNRFEHVDTPHLIIQYL